MAPYRLYPSSLDPPALSADDVAAAEENLPLVLLELKAYVAKRDNATTAVSRTWDGKQIQVTFCPRRPPLVSYVCVYSPDAAEFHVEPKVLAVEDRLVVLSITVGPQKDVAKNVDYYVYQADDGSGEPSLKHLPRPPYFFDAENIGILRYRTDDQSGVFLRLHRPGDNTAYIVAGLHRAPSGQPRGQFGLCLYDSKRGGWKNHTVSLNQQEQEQHGGDGFFHHNCKVLAIGGDAGTMAFVDLWRGILFCDVRRVEGKSAPLLRYVALPQPLQRNKLLEGDARLYRNIALIGDRLKYIELQLHWKASVLYRDTFFRDGWMAATWSRPATSSSDSDRWREDSRIMDSKELKVNSNSHFELLPKVQTDEGVILSPFKRLDVCQPMLGLDDNDDVDIVYFTTKRERVDANAWVVAVDLRNKEVLAVADFAASRYVGINFAYVHGRVSRYLKSTPTSGMQSDLKRPGILLPQSSGKKHFGMEAHKSTG